MSKSIPITDGALMAWHWWKKHILTPPGVQVSLVFLLVIVVSAWLAPREVSEPGRIRSITLQILLVCGTPFLAGKLVGLKLDSFYKLQPISALQSVLAILLGLCLISWLEEVQYLQVQVSGEADQLEQQARSWLQISSYWDLIWILLSMAIIPAICEEFLFRGFILHQLLAPGHSARAVLVSAVMFGLFHRHFFLFFPGILAGILFALMVIRSGSLLTAILAHFTVNASAIVVSNWKINTSFSWLSQATPVPLVVLVLCGFGIIIFSRQLIRRDFQKYGKDNKTK